MASRRFSRRRRVARRPGRKADVVPLVLCHDTIAIPKPTGDETFWTCTAPYLFAVPLVDGGAMQNILAFAAGAASDPTDYYTSQGISRGLSFLGAQFDSIVSYVGDPNQTFQGSDYSAFFVTGAFGIARIQVDRSLGGIRFPSVIPNLYSRDEQECGDILLRWSWRLPFYSFDPTHDDQGTNPTATIYQTDTTGCQASWFEYLQGGNPTNRRYYTVGNGSSTSIHHRVKSRRFLDEEHALYFVGAIEVPQLQADVLDLGLDVLGYLAVKGR